MCCVVLFFPPSILILGRVHKFIPRSTLHDANAANSRVLFVLKICFFFAFISCGGGGGSGVKGGGGGGGGEGW